MYLHLTPKTQLSVRHCTYYQKERNWICNLKDDFWYTGRSFQPPQIYWLFLSFKRNKKIYLCYYRLAYTVLDFEINKSVLKETVWVSTVFCSYLQKQIYCKSAVVSCFSTHLILELLITSYSYLNMSKFLPK